MIKLRNYQEKAINDIKTAFSQGLKHIILQAPTGAGKTVIFTEIGKRIAEKGNKILILTDRVELLTQAGGSLKNIGLNSYFIHAGINVVNKNFTSYIAMSQTLRRRIDKPYWIDFINSIDLFIIDEVHKQEFNYLFESNLLDNKFVIGFTATPKRSGKMRQLGLDFEKIIPTKDVKELIQDGYLMQDDYYGLSSPDLSGVGYDAMKGDFKTSQMFNEYNTPKLYSGVVKNYKKIVNKTKTLVFCVNIEHCIRTAIEFQNEGFNARFITSGVSKPKYPKDAENKGKIEVYNERLRVYNLYNEYFVKYSGKREDIFSDFKNNKFDILINAGIATTGYDCPSIETIILNRATLSVTLLLQMVGRGSRLHFAKTHFNILDFGGNCQRLGYYSENRTWSLWHDYKKGTGVPPVKECGFNNDGKPIKAANNVKGCRRLILASYKICPFCGFKYPDKKKKEIELNNYLYNGFKAIKTKNLNEMNFEELFFYWKEKGHKSAWLWRQLWYRNKENSIRNFGKKYNWSQNTINKAIKFCVQRINY